jgi:hypothetical protein
LFEFSTGKANGNLALRLCESLDCKEARFVGHCSHHTHSAAIVATFGLWSQMPKCLAFICVCLLCLGRPVFALNLNDLIQGAIQNGTASGQFMARLRRSAPT